jgi:hypothetical protein
MKQSKFPPGWDEERVQRVTAYYENQTEDEAVAEDEKAFRHESITTVEVPIQLVPTVHKLIAKHRSQNRRRDNKTFHTSKVRSVLSSSHSKEWSSRWVHRS